MGNDSPSTTTLVDGVGFKSETDINGAKIVTCYTDKGGWNVNPLAGQNDPAPMPDDVYNAGKGQIFVGGPLYDYAAKGSKVELMGKDGNNYKIKLTTKEGVDSTYLIDATTFLVARSSRRARCRTRMWTSPQSSLTTGRRRSGTWFPTPSTWTSGNSH